VLEFPYISDMFKILTFTIFIYIFSCSTNQEPELPVPEKVILVPHAPDTAAIEIGIDAVPEFDGIQVQWYDLNDFNVSTYTVYRKSESETFFREIKEIDLETASAGFDTTYIDGSVQQGLEKNIYYSYYVTATNKDDKEGPSSDTLRYLLLEKPEINRPNSETFTQNELPTFDWEFPGVIPDNYILRIEDDFTKQIVFVRRFQVENYFPAQSIILATVENPPIFTTGIYRWRIDSIGPDDETSGSESLWLSFFVN
jgi:hypothetical protein